MTGTISIIIFIIVISPNLARSQNNNNTPSSSSSSDSYYYSLCSPFKCGFFNFTFPFTNNNNNNICGLQSYTITCDTSSSIAYLQFGPRPLQVKGLYPSANDQENNTIIVSDARLINDLRDGRCESLQNFSSNLLSFSNQSPNIAPLQLPPWNVSLIFYSCPLGLSLSEEFLINGTAYNYPCNGGATRLYLASKSVSRKGDGGLYSSGDPVEAPSGCDMVRVPVIKTSLSQYDLLNRSRPDAAGLLWNVLGEGFPLQWPRIRDCDACESRGGRCGFNASLGRTVCFCEGCHQTNKNNGSKRPGLIIGLAIGGTFLLLGTLGVSLVIFKFNKKFLTFKRDKGSLGESKIQKFMENYSSNLTTGYSYSDIKKMTKSFKYKIGEGGYGTVFKGVLPNGRLVAVKMLEKSKDNGQEFINEVATIGIIHHVNIIRLLGYCCDGSKRALVYEYMPNGSLGNLIHKENSRSLSHSLGWKKLLEIVKGIAYGIEYLHHGCDSRILHLDIKPHNILLDNDFIPKISDFGLAKLYSRSDSVVALTGGARGTIGYIAPEIFLSNLGCASHKSDVYSFGMLLLEILGLKSENHQITSVQNPSTSSSTSRSYFPDWVYEKLIQKSENPHHHQHDIVTTEEDDANISRKFIVVALWCIQMHPNKRPSMSKVVEMLSAESVEGIEIPPKPFFCSPPRNVNNKSYISSISNTSDLPVASDSE